MSSLCSSIAGINFDFPVSNASGPRCTNQQEISNLVQSAAGYVVTKSLTKQPRVGNPGPKWYADTSNTINANGLENLGFETTLEFLRKSREQNPYRIIIPSIAVLDIDDSLEMVSQLAKESSVFPLVEVNVSCPNIPGKPILANSLERLKDYFESLQSVIGDSPIRVGIKLPFYTDKIIVQEVDSILLEHAIDYIVICNSFPFSTDVDLDSYKLCIHPNSGLGGLGGSSILRPTLGQIRMHYANLVGEVDIVGVGGGGDATAALKHFICGATSHRIGSAFSIYGCDIFEQVHKGISDYLFQKNISHLTEIIGSAVSMPWNELT